MATSLFCPLRKIWVTALPEEKVRQALIQEMVERLGYPLGYLAVEKNLDQLPHLKDQTFPPPKRRADLIVFAKELHPQHVFYPLLLVECKAVSLTDKVLRQIIGYNQFVGAYFVAAANQTQLLFGCYHPDYKDFKFQKGLPPYDALLHYARTSQTQF